MDALRNLDEALGHDCGDQDTEVCLVLPNKLLFQIAKAVATQTLWLSPPPSFTNLIEYRYRPETMDAMPYTRVQTRNRQIVLLGTDPIAMKMEAPPRICSMCGGDVKARPHQRDCGRHDFSDGDE